MAQRTLGIDVAKATLDVALLRPSDRQQAQFDNDAAGHQRLLRWLKKRSQEGRPHVCLEATGQYGDAIATLLHEEGYVVSVVNPARIKAYGQSKLQRNKTDKADALLIAEFCLKQEPSPWTPPPASFRDLQALVRRLEDLQDNRQQEKNRLQAGVATPAVVTSLQEHIAYLETQIAQVRDAIRQHFAQYPERRAQRDLLDSIPGVGELTAVRLLGEIRTITDFDGPRQLAAYAGLTPRNHCSGSSVRRKAQITKTGNAHLRRALFMPSLTAQRYNPIVKAFCERLAEKGLAPMQIAVAAMHKLLHLAYGVLKSGRPFDPHCPAKGQA